MPAPGLPCPTLARRYDIGSYKKAIASWMPGGVGLMYAYSVGGDFGSAAASAFFAGSDVPGGDFETLCLEPWLSGPTNPASGPVGLGQSPTQVSATIALLRTNTTIVQAATPLGAAVTAATFAKVANTGVYADLAGLPTIPVLPTLAKVATSGAYTDLSGLPAASDIVAAGMAAFLGSLPTTQPAAAGVLWMNGGTLQISQPQGS